ncbi:hypothetical protein BACI349Y_510011 [Bacillus sp. 349Y]|nr:hypothetical protein BACI349Y_510011 [Bacillus sp. 349Y]
MLIRKFLLHYIYVEILESFVFLEKTLIPSVYLKQENSPEKFYLFRQFDGLTTRLILCIQLK